MDMADAGKKVVEKVLNQFGDTPTKAIPAETVNRGKEALERILEEYGTMPIKILNSLRTYLTIASSKSIEPMAAESH